MPHSQYSQITTDYAPWPGLRLRVPTPAMLQDCPYVPEPYDRVDKPIDHLRRPRRTTDRGLTYGLLLCSSRLTK